MCTLIDTLDYNTMMSIGKNPEDEREIVRVYSCGTVIIIETADKNIHHSCDKKLLLGVNAFCYLTYENKYFRNTRIFIIDDTVIVDIVSAVKYMKSKLNIGLKESRDLIEKFENMNFLEYRLIGKKQQLSQELASLIRLNAREIYMCDPSDMYISVKFNCDESAEYLVMVYRKKGCMLRGYGFSLEEAFRNCLTEFCNEIEKRISTLRETINSLENSIKKFKN